jgi:hypothetical protein
MKGLEGVFGSENVLWLRAHQLIQGHEANEPEAGEDKETAFSQKISELRRTKGFKVVGFTKVQFSSNVGTGNPGVVDRIHVLEQEQAVKPWSQRDLGFIFLGHGDQTRIPSHNPTVMNSYAGALSIMNTIFGLQSNGEVASILEQPHPRRWAQEANTEPLPLNEPIVVHEGLANLIR